LPRMPSPRLLPDRIGELLRMPMPLSTLRSPVRTVGDTLISPLDWLLPRLPPQPPASAETEANEQTSATVANAVNFFMTLLPCLAVPPLPSGLSPTTGKPLMREKYN